MNTGQPQFQVLLRQVLDVYRQPLRYRKLWADTHHDLPKGIGYLLDLAVAPPAVLDDHAARLYTSQEELTAAIHFFIHQVLLSEENDAYRMLGLTPAATPGEIKSHYRKLIRLYHPDRYAGNEWSNIYAPRINRAYNVLRALDRRPVTTCASPVRTDNRDKTADWPLPRQHTLNPPHPVRKVNGHLLIVELKSFLARGRPSGFVFAVSCAAVALGVGFIGWNLLTWLTLLELPNPQMENKLTTVALSSPGSSSSWPPPAWLESIFPTPVKSAESESVRTYGLDTHERSALERAARSVPQIQINTAEKSSIPVGRIPVGEAEHPPPVTSAIAPATTPLAGVEPALRGLSVRELKTKVLDRLVAAYQQGDLGALTSLFSAHAITNKLSSREAIRLEYARFFANTKQRELRLSQFHWQIDNQTAIGRGKYNLKVSTLEQNTRISYEGTLLIDVGKGPEGPLINGFFQYYREAP